MAVPSANPSTPDLLWRRIGAGAIDWGIVVVVAVIAGLVLSSSFAAGMVTLAYQLLALVWWQGRTGASPGKQLVGLRTVDATGQPCGTGKAALRWLSWIVDGFPYCLPVVAFIMVFTNPDQRRVGDKVAGTWVVDQRQTGRRPLAAASRAELERGPEPVWDDLLQVYVRTDPVSGRRQAFDESTNHWTAVEE
jgi:uncharacterized RDD family membrane protein YckC